MVYDKSCEVTFADLDLYRTFESDGYAAERTSLRELLAQKYAGQYQNTSTEIWGWELASDYHNSREEENGTRYQETTSFTYVLGTDGSYWLIKGKTEEWTGAHRGSSPLSRSAKQINPQDYDSASFLFATDFEGYCERYYTNHSGCACADFGTHVWYFDSLTCGANKTLTRKFPKKGEGLYEAIKNIADNDIQPTPFKLENEASVSQQQETQKRSGGCYVATAVYGSYDCPQVWTLRRYRDGRLLTSPLGRAFVRTYYATSPTLVKLFGDSAAFKRICRRLLDPFVAKLNAQRFEATPHKDVRAK